MYQFATAAAAVCVYLFLSVWSIRVLSHGVWQISWSPPCPVSRPALDLVLSTDGNEDPLGFHISQSRRKPLDSMYVPTLVSHKFASAPQYFVYLLWDKANSVLIAELGES